ncbi:YfgM family protein [Suttonella ornithocola]|uniref:Uncharacterized protein conserved in bacteria n=1 Tax=Suttonella ornithocola TaxID=279832 RepID=A0A380MUL6_9GAMM|nr:tetratricopeptide repeat protein [Suttonella ornithocola]SUO95874.1 Uncharacterized protein conserved in bacteria [Suttonella ornithocola]
MKKNPLKALLERADNSLVVERSDEETGELVKSWLRRHGPVILAGVVIALIVLFAMSWWKNRQHTIDTALAYQLETLQKAIADNDVDLANNLYQKSLINNDQAYGKLAALMMAKVYVNAEKNTQARTALEKATKAKDALVAQTAQWELANLEMIEKNYGAALGLLSQLSETAYKGQAKALEGDIYLLQENFKAALNAYQQSLLVVPSPLVRMKAEVLEADQAMNAPSEG